jgi:hypothetical protein
MLREEKITFLQIYLVIMIRFVFRFFLDLEGERKLSQIPPFSNTRPPGLGV